MPLKKHYRNLWLTALMALTPASLHAAEDWAQNPIEGLKSNIHNQYEQIYVGQKNWDRLWTQEMGMPGKPPKVDFSREMAVAIFFGEAQSPGYGVEIATVARRGQPGCTTIYYSYSAPADRKPGEKQYPYALLKFPKSKTIALEYDADLGQRLSNPSELLKPAAEVRASSGPIQLTLSLLRTKLAKAVTRKEDPLWFQVTVKNRGHDILMIPDKIFWNPGSEWAGSRGVFLDIRGPDGKPQEKNTFDRDYDPSGNNNSSDGRGLTEAQPEGPQLKTPEPRAYVFPGGAMSTPARSYSNNFSRAPGQFTMPYELKFWTPGRYRIRAVYDRNPAHSALTGDLAKYNTIDYGDVEARTPWIEFEVLP
jgi:hypothetical protein